MVGEEEGFYRSQIWDFGLPLHGDTTLEDFLHVRTVAYSNSFYQGTLSKLQTN